MKYRLQTGWPPCSLKGKKDVRVLDVKMPDREIKDVSGYIYPNILIAGEENFENAFPVHQICCLALNLGSQNTRGLD